MHQKYVILLKHNYELGQVESKGIIVKKKYSLPKDIPQGTII